MSGSSIADVSTGGRVTTGQYRTTAADTVGQYRTARSESRARSTVGGALPRWSPWSRRTRALPRTGTPGGSRYRRSVPDSPQLGRRTIWGCYALGLRHRAAERLGRCRTIRVGQYRASRGIREGQNWASGSTREGQYWACVCVSVCLCVCVSVHGHLPT
eukprot:1338339-Rhodomonas_salina.3